MNPVSNQKNKDWQKFSSKEAQHLFEVITGRLHFPVKPFTKEDLDPDLIIRMRVPEEQFMKRSIWKPASAFVRVPSEQLEQAFNAGQQKIMDEMTQVKENEDNKEVRFRLNKSLIHLDKPQTKITKMMHVTNEEQIFELECLDQKENLLDGYTLDFNTIVYLLEEKCGFRVRAFMVNSMEPKKNALLSTLGISKIIDTLSLDTTLVHVRDIYLFLNLSIENLLKVAARFMVKKELHYSILDMSLNDPSTSDGRPFRFHSQFVNNKQFLKNMKSISRYFKTRQINSTNSQIVNEKQLTLGQIQKFMSYWEEICLIFQFFKNVLSNEVSNEEKIYLYQYNRGKINQGCEKRLTIQKKIHQYYQLIKEVNIKYGYPSLDQPDFYEEFIMPNKNSKGGFFNKLNSMLIYKAQRVTPYGDQSLFNSMERTKLCYIMVKETFKINYLNRIGCDIFMLNNDFQKLGRGGKDQKVIGGLNGSFLEQRWNMFALFSDIKLIRSYFGDVIAFEITIKTAIIFLLLALSAPTIMLFIFELLYGELVLIVTDYIEIGLFVSSFSVFILYVQEQQQRFAAIYSDKKPSSIFLNEYRGPYIRNPLSDQVNEYVQESGFMVLLKNFVCLIVFVILIVCFGAFFYGCRNLLISISASLYNYQTKFVSLSHVIAYCLYFLLGDVFKFKFYGYIVNFMIFIKNPPTDQIERHQRSYFTFYYLLVMECIPIFFFFILEPFRQTSCYADNCSNQFQLYIYARFLFNLGMAALSLLQVFFLGWGKRTILELQANLKEKEYNSFHQKLGLMLTRAIKQNKKLPYQEGLTRDILTLFAYCFYCAQFTISGVVALLYIITIYVVMRASLMHQVRRPINKSQPIVPFSNSCYVIYFCGLIFNIWNYTFLSGYTEKYYGFAIKYAPAPITYESIFMIKIILTTLFFILYSLLGILVRKIVIFLSPKTIAQRQKNKYQQYRRTVGGPKTRQARFKEFEPLKTIFRIFNPVVRPDDKLQEVLQRMNEQSYAKMGMKILQKQNIKQNLNLLKSKKQRTPKLESDKNMSQTRLKGINQL